MKSEIAFSITPGNILYSKEFYICTASILDVQSVIDQRIVNQESGRKHIYPYGGYLGPDGPMGDTLYMTVSSDVSSTKITLHTHQELIQKGINPLVDDRMYAFQGIDPSQRHKILPLMTLIEEGGIKTENKITIGDQAWVQTYQSESLIRKEGTYEAILTFKRNGKPTIKRD